MPVVRTPSSSLDPVISAIVPSLDGSRGGNIDRLVGDLEQQDCAPLEVLLVTGERPSGNARHLGSDAAKGEYLVFIDDDAQLGSHTVISRLVRALAADRQIGLAGVTQQLPANLSPIRSWMGKQLPRTVSPVVDEITDSDMVTTLCVATTRQVYDRVGGMNRWMIAGVDPELRQRVRNSGYRVVVVPGVVVQHPMPGTVRKIAHYAFVKGKASAWQFRYARNLSFDCTEGHRNGEAKQNTLLFRVFRKGFQMIVSILKLRPIRLIHDFFYVAGYCRGLTQDWDLAGPEGNVGKRKGVH